MTEEWWCWKCHHVATSVGALDLHVLGEHSASTFFIEGNPAAPTSVKLREAEHQRDKFIAVADKLHGEWLDLKFELVDVRHEWAKDVDALIEARQEIERQAIHIERLEAAVGETP